MRNLAPLLLDFLKLYGGNFNYQRVGIDVAAEQTGLPVFYPLVSIKLTLHRDWRSENLTMCAMYRLP